MRGLSLLLCLTLTGCDDGEATTPEPPTDAGTPDALPFDATPDAGLELIPLIAHSAWAPTPTGSDPFGELIGDRTRCEDEDELYVETLGTDEVLSIDTSFCGYATVEQPLLAPLSVGDEVRVRRFHFPVNIPEVTEGYVGLALAGDIKWSITVPLPAESGGETALWTADGDYPSGTPVHYHVHNHGANEWVLIEVLRARPR